MKKRILCLFLGVVMVLSMALTACSSGDEAAANVRFLECQQMSTWSTAGLTFLFAGGTDRPPLETICTGTGDCLGSGNFRRKPKIQIFRNQINGISESP